MQEETDWRWCYENPRAAAALIDKMRAAITAECHRLEHDYNEADVTEARRALRAAAAS